MGLFVCAFTNTGL